MKTIAFMNVKGGVGKTTSSISFSYILSSEYKKKVLIIDLDKQANSSRALNVYDIDKLSSAELLTERNIDINTIIRPTKYKNLDIIPANMHLVKANQSVLLDMSRPQQTRILKALKSVENIYDYCIIDCPTDINMAVINAFVVANDVLIPIKIDRYSFDGLEYVIEAISDMQEFNPNLCLRGAFVTMYQNNNLNKQGFELLEKNLGIRLMKTKIRTTVKVQESTYISPLPLYAPKSTAAEDYRDLVKEYMEE